MTDKQNVQPNPDTEISNYCPLCGRSEKRKYSEGNHWSEPFSYGGNWWARGLCPDCGKG